MKVIALGGCGAMGRRAVRFIVDNSKIDEIVVADLNFENARNFAAEFSDKVTAARIDVTDAAAMDNLLKDADVILNTVGPFYKYGTAVLSAAIRNSTHYLDINDDWEPTLEMLEFDEAARTAGITAVIGMGGGPGLSNMMGRAAIKELESVDTLYILMNMDAADVDDSDFAAGKLDENYINAAAAHSMQQMANNVRVREGGRFVETPAWRKVEFKDLGSGVSSGRILGHPEPITFPLYFPEIQESAALMLTSDEDGALTEDLVAKVRAGTISQEDGARILVQAVGDREPPETCAAGDPARGLKPMLMAYAKGKKNGTERHVTVCVKAAPGPGMANLTSIPLGVALNLLIAGKITRHGVFAPEAGIDPDDFFDALAPSTYPPCNGREDLIVTTIA